ncbi:hypothetical protein [Streptomyces sp. NPDC026589]|uniref:hypothetical protein n=1 Tax=Streptomyces sp. NPDC026589 TaxID=3155609 RepID=UPI0033FF8584
MDETTVEEVLYSAELRHAKGKCMLVINDHSRGNEEVYVVPKAAVKKFPFYLAMLKNKLS